MCNNVFLRGFRHCHCEFLYVWRENAPAIVPIVCRTAVVVVYLLLRQRPHESNKTCKIRRLLYASAFYFPMVIDLVWRAWLV